jgi:hypothetical protein
MSCASKVNSDQGFDIVLHEMMALVAGSQSSGVVHDVVIVQAKNNKQHTV